MQYKFDVLGAGDSVIGVWDGHFAVRHPSDEVEVYNYSVDEYGYPHLGDNTILVCQSAQPSVPSTKEDRLEALNRLSHLLSEDEIEELDKHPIERVNFRERIGA